MNRYWWKIVVVVDIRMCMQEDNTVQNYQGRQFKALFVPDGGILRDLTHISSLWLPTGLCANIYIRLIVRVFLRLTAVEVSKVLIILIPQVQYPPLWWCWHSLTLFMEQLNYLKLIYKLAFYINCVGKFKYNYWLTTVCVYAIWT